MKHPPDLEPKQSITFQEGFHLAPKNGGHAVGSVVLLHGLTGTPAEMENLAYLLNQQGYYVTVPRLSGHGESLDVLRKIKTWQWISDAEKAYEEAKQASQGPVMIAGLSFGGLLALYLGCCHQEIAAIAALSVPFQFNAPGRELPLRLFSYLPEKSLDLLGVKKKRARKENYLAFARQAYTSHSIGAGARLIKIRRMVRYGLKNIKCPLLLMQDPLDHHIALHSPLLIKEKVSSCVSKLSYVLDGEHELLIGHRHEEVTGEIVSFFEAANLSEKG